MSAVTPTITSSILSTVIGTIVSDGGSRGRYEWVPNLNMVNRYGLYSAVFTPSGADTALDITFFNVENGAIQQVLDGSASAFSVAISATNVLSFALLTSVELNGVAATSGVTTVPEGYHTLTGILDATADMLTVAAVTTTFVNPFTSQIHGWGFDDVTTPGNSQLINTIINSDEMPTLASHPESHEIYNSLTGLKIGDWFNLGPDNQQPYVPVLRGDNDPLKFEVYNGSQTTPAGSTG